MDRHKLLLRCFLFFILVCCGINSKASYHYSLKHLQQAYPQHIKSVSSKYITWHDGTRIFIENSFPSFDQLFGLFAKSTNYDGIIREKDIERETYEDLFRKMYGDTPSKVKKNLVTIYWMPKVFGTRYPLRVTTVNDVHKKLQRISAELEKLPPSYYKYLDRPAGSFYWRRVEGEDYLSSHSYGIAIDINSHYANYWLWDYKRLRRPIDKLNCPNRVPMKIVEIFEKEGFYWGGRWYFYDTMHFEYRPDLMIGQHRHTA